MAGYTLPAHVAVDLARNGEAAWVVAEDSPVPDITAGYIVAMLTLKGYQAWSTAHPLPGHRGRVMHVKLPKEA